MKRITEETSLEFSRYSQLSYIDKGKADVMLYIDKNLVGRIEVWTDRGNKNREYIIVNNEVIYLDSIKRLTDEA